VLENLPMILKAGIDILLGLIDGITSALPSLIPAIVDAIILIVDVLIDNLPLILKAGIDILLGLIKGIVGAIPKLIDAIPKLIESIIETLTDPKMMMMLIQASIELVIALAGGLIKAIPQLIMAIPKIIVALVKGFANSLSSMASIGKDLVTGIWDGISNATNWIMDKIRGFGSSILDSIKGFFGIKSPSRLFRDEIGKNLAYGVGDGFTDSMKGVTKDMQNALPSSLDTDISLNSRGLMSSVGETNRLARVASSDNMVTAIQQALKGVKVELDDKPLGKFVIGTVEGAVF